MKMLARNTTPPNRGQGALEYLLLIGGAVLVATVVLVIILTTSGSTNTIITNNISTFQHQITLNAGTGGGGGGAVCGNGNVQAGEACDDGDTSPGDGCDGSCNIESGWTCADNPSVCNPIPPAAPNFSFSAATGSGAHQVDLTWNVTSNYDGTAYNVVKGWIGSSPAITDPVSFQSATGQDFTYNVTAANSSSPVFGTSSNVSYTVYMVACNGAGVTNSNCTLSSVQTPTSGYDAILFEAESMQCASNPNCLLSTAGLQQTTQGAYTFLRTISGTCSAGVDNFATIAMTLDNGGTANYNLWVRTRNASNTTAYNTPRSIEPNSTSSQTPFGLGTYNWYPGAATVSGGNGSQTAKVTIPCASNGLLLVDKLVYTTDNSCDPNTSVTECA